MHVPCCSWADIFPPTTRPPASHANSPWKKTCACMTWTQPQKPWRRTKTWRPYPAETPPLRGSGADAFTASSSSMVYGVGLLGPAFPAFGPQVEWPDTNIGPTCPTPLVPKICPNPLVPKILPVVAILALRAFVGRITVYPASQCLKCLLWAPSSLSTRSRATGQIREKKEEKTAINGSNLSERKRKFVFSTRTSWDWLTIGDCINIAHYIGFWQMHCRKRIPSLTMMTRFTISLCQRNHTITRSPQCDDVWCNPKGVINSFLQLISLSCWGASLARKWSWCFNGIVVVHGVCGRVASARISCFRASSGLARHKYWPNMPHPVSC